MVSKRISHQPIDHNEFAALVIRKAAYFENLCLIYVRTLLIYDLNAYEGDRNYLKNLNVKEKNIK